MVLATQLRFDEALTEIQRAHELDPLSPIISTAVGRILYFARRFDEVIDHALKRLNSTRSLQSLTLTSPSPTL